MEQATPKEPRYYADGDRVFWRLRSIAAHGDFHICTVDGPCMANAAKVAQQIALALNESGY